MGAKLARVTAFLQLAVYRALSGIAHVLPLRGKLGESIAARRSAEKRWTARGWAQRPPKMIWFHAASVGEALTAEPVIRRIRTARPDAGIVLTWSSPSVGRFPHRFGADHVDAAPPETRGGAAGVFSSIRPDLVVLSRSELWPEMLVAARDRGVPVAVIGGALRAGSARLRSPAVHFYRSLVEPIRFVGALTHDHGIRWMKLGINPSGVLVTGDPRHDQVLERVTGLPALRSLLPWSRKGSTLVAGSVETEDETVVLEGLAAVLRRHPAARALVVPHDPAEHVTARLLQRSQRLGVPAESLRVVSQRGILADAYLLGNVAYIGGGFRERGLHAVIEPAVYGVPVIHGPLYRSSGDAVSLVDRGGAVALPRSDAGRALADQWNGWIENNEARLRAGMAARNSLSQGAAAISARSLLSLLD